MNIAFNKKKEMNNISKQSILMHVKESDLIVVQSTNVIQLWPIFFLSQQMSSFLKLS